jgi:hypothetical protein
VRLPDRLRAVDDCVQPVQPPVPPGLLAQAIDALADAGAVTKNTAIDSTYVKAQRAAFGAKGGVRRKQSAVRAVDGPRRSMPSPTSLCVDADGGRRYRGRYLIENAFCRLKDFRRVHTRYSLPTSSQASPLPPLWRSGSKEVWALNSILDVEASHLALSKTENVSDRLVSKPVRLPLQRFAFEIADGLPDLCDDRAIRSSMKAHRLDVRTDHAPLARPILAYGLAAMDVATIHTVGPGDIIGEHGQHTVYIPRVKAIVDALKEFDITIHWFSPWHGARSHRMARPLNIAYTATCKTPRAIGTRFRTNKNRTFDGRDVFAQYRRRSSDVATRGHHFGP